MRRETSKRNIQGRAKATSHYIFLHGWCRSSLPSPLKGGNSDVINEAGTGALHLYRIRPASLFLPLRGVARLSTWRRRYSESGNAPYRMTTQHTPHFQIMVLLRCISYIDYGCFQMSSRMVPSAGTNILLVRSSPICNSTSRSLFLSLISNSSWDWGEASSGVVCVGFSISRAGSGDLSRPSPPSAIFWRRYLFVFSLFLWSLCFSFVRSRVCRFPLLWSVIRPHHLLILLKNAALLLKRGGIPPYLGRD